MNVTPERLQQIAHDQGATGLAAQDHFLRASGARDSCSSSAAIQPQDLVDEVHFKSGGRYVLRFPNTSFAEQASLRHQSHVYLKGVVGTKDIPGILPPAWQQLSCNMHSRMAAHD